MSDGKTTKAELAEAVRELREEVAALRAERETHHCLSLCGSHVHCAWGHCGCFSVHGYYPFPSVWYGTVANSGNLTMGAAGCNPNPVYGYSVTVASETGAVVTSGGYSVSASN